MSDTSQPESRFGRFVAYMDSLSKDRGAMADLRHGFSEGTAYRAWPHVAPWCDLTNPRQRVIILAVAGGFATHGGSDAKAGNLGHTLRRVAKGNGKKDTGLASFEGRFRRLLSCNTPAELCGMLPGMLRAAERRGVGVNYALLYRDLTYWTADTRAKVAWAAAFWGTEQPSEEESA
jgi:CRISPR type I-E-associated protein CasB/Cse2